MRSVWALFAVALMCVWIAACGGTSRSTVAASTTSSSAAITPAPPLPPGEANLPYVKDPDVDIGGANQNSGYRDKDDSRILAYYGRPASTAVRQEVASIASRYYAIAAAGKSKQACAMMSRGLLSEIPLVYGEFGASYLRGAKTCAALVSRLFAHRHRELIVPVVVTGVLVKSDHAYALLGSRKIPASFLALVDEHGEWMVERLIGAPVI
jgi:hypothetical protein